MSVLEVIKGRTVFFDGGMGTELQKRGLRLGGLPEALNIDNKEIIIGVHLDYLRAGSDIITTNTFGASSIKLKDYALSPVDVITCGIQNAKEAIIRFALERGNDNKYIAYDIGPLGKLLKPMGSLSFEEAYELFREQVIIARDQGVDLILIETMSDILEAKAAILAVKENSDLPLFATMTFSDHQRTFSGTDPLTMVNIFQCLGVDVLGVNCSFGPKELKPIVDEILKYSKVPVLVQANAGIPNREGIYSTDASEYAELMKDFVLDGVALLGGCCGTDSRYIRQLVSLTKDLTPKINNVAKISAVSSPRRTIILDRVRVVGERINPTGKKMLKQALVNGDIDYVIKEAIAQAKEGADILDINLGVPGLDEASMMERVIAELQSVIDLPLQIDSVKPEVIERGLRAYCGRAIINSVSGEAKSLDTILPLAKKYGALVIGLTLDEKGISSKAEDRFDIAKRIVDKALEHGLSKEDVIIDTLTLTASSSQLEVMETIKAIILIKEKLGVKTTLGVSNVSFGLPNRELLNRTFLSLALCSGLDLPIINPADKDVMDTIHAYNVLSAKDIGFTSYMERFSETKRLEPPDKSEILSLKELIVKGIRNEARDVTIKLLSIHRPEEIVDGYIVPALDLVGRLYDKGELYLPQLVMAAEAAGEAFSEVQKLLPKVSETKGKVLLATVKGDIHDIGKNIVKSLLQSYGYGVVDMGKDVEPLEILKKLESTGIKLLGLSALMTTTLPSMEESIELIRDKNLDCKIMVGGAVLNEEYAQNICADFYGKDAKEAVEIAKKVFGE